MTVDQYVRKAWDVPILIVGEEISKSAEVGLTIVDPGGEGTNEHIVATYNQTAIVAVILDIEPGRIELVHRGSDRITPVNKQWRIDAYMEKYGTCIEVIRKM